MNFDIHRQSQHHPQSSTRDPSSFSNARPLNHGPELYSAVLAYDYLTMFSELREYDQQIKTFLQYSFYNTLFIFGPSGSGKHLLLKNHLRKNKIPCAQRLEQHILAGENQQMEEDQPLYKIKTIREQLNEVLLQKFATQVDIFDEFPLSSLDTSAQEIIRNHNFKKQFFQSIDKANCKAIFVLNSQIYNSYYIIPPEKPPSVMVINLRPYTNTQIKNIIKDFCEKFPVFQYIRSKSRKEELEQIIELANGDARKALLSIYQNYILLVSAQSKPIELENHFDNKIKLKNVKKFPLFHLLGKYLYAKRYDAAKKTDRNFSREQLQNLDPPFYFNPLETFNRSFVPLSIFSNLIFENYITFYASTKDIKQILEVFVHLNSGFPTFITNKKLDSDSEITQRLFIFLLTWGTILKNKSAKDVQRGFKQFRSSRNTYVDRQIQAKKQIIKKYFKKYPLSTLIKFGFIARNTKCQNHYIFSSLILKKNPINRNIKDDSSRISDQEETFVENQYNKGVNQQEIRNKIQAKQKQKKIEKDILLEFDEPDSDYSDIEES